MTIKAQAGPGATRPAPSLQSSQLTSEESGRLAARGAGGEAGPTEDGRVPDGGADLGVGHGESPAEDGSCICPFPGEDGYVCENCPVHDPDGTYHRGLYPAPELRCHPFISVGELGDITRPRLFCYTDGDGTNAVINLGIHISADSTDDLLSVGVDLKIPPRLLWMIDMPAALLKRLRRGSRS